MSETKPRILIVDDNASNVKLVSFLLTKHGFDVRCAGSGEQALELLESFSPHLILMDLQLPGLDGYALTRRLRARPGMGDVVIVALTAYAMKGDAERALAAGCDHHLAKPIDTRTLPGIVATLIEEHQRKDLP